MGMLKSMDFDVYPVVGADLGPPSSSSVGRRPHRRFRSWFCCSEKTSCFFTALGKNILETSSKTLKIMAHPKLRPFVIWVHIYILKSHLCPQHMDRHPAWVQCILWFLSWMWQKCGVTRIDTQLMTSTHKKPFSLFPLTSHQCPHTLQGAELAQSSLSAGWGLGKGHC